MKTEKIIASITAVSIATSIPAALCKSTTNAYLYQNIGKYNQTVVSADESYSIGDINNDKVINANDASLILAEYASLSVGGDSTFSDIQKISADMDKNGTVDATDASIILAYYSYAATGGNETIEQYLARLYPENNTTTTTSITTTSTTAISETNTTTTVSASSTSDTATSETTLSSSKTTDSTSSTSITTTNTTTTTVSDSDKVSEIRLNQTVCNIDVGESGWAAIVTMLPETASNKGEIWISSDENIATVTQDGWVTGIKKGTCIITVKSVDNPKVSAQVTVNVTDISSVKEIRLNRNAATVETGYCGYAAIVEMLPNTAPNKKEIWKSSDDSIASVDENGWIETHKAGSCIITVKSEDNPTVSDTILVTVVDDISTTTSTDVSTTCSETTTTATSATTTTTNMRVSKIELSKYEMTVPVGCSDISMVTMLPEDVSDKNEIWISSDENIATVDKYGWVKGISVGECKVTVYSVNNPAVYAEIAVKVVESSENINPPKPNFSYISENLSTNKSIAFYTPFPEKASGEYEIDYVITDTNGKSRTEKSDILFLPDMDSVTTRLTAETNDFTVTTYLTNLKTGECARIGTYEFTLTPNNAETVIEDIYYAFYIIGGISE